jgi:prepilin-type N-terminal cleavage/methylation domain-containing protein
MTKRLLLRHNGYTMIELMSVVAMIGILAAMAVPVFLSMTPRLNLKSDARNSLNYLRLARSRAVAENSQYGVFFDAGNDRLIYFMDTNDPASAIYDAGQDSVLDSTITLHHGVSYNSVSFASNSVVFLPNGSASESGTIVLDHAETSRTYTINVLASTGKVSLH